MTDAILATSNGYRDMADGTLRLTLDIEPSDAANALALFGKRGSAVALVRITDEAAIAHDCQREEPDDPLPPHKPPPTLCAKAGMLCRERTFYEFARTSPLFVAHQPDEHERDGTFPTHAKVVLRHFCGVESRRDLDTDPTAGSRFQTIVAEYELWQRDRPSHPAAA